VLPSVHVLAAAAPVVDIDGTLIVQGVIFLLLVAILGRLLFRPWLETQARRADSIGGALKEADRMRAKADKLDSEYETRLAAAREDANLIRSTAYREEEARQAERVADTRAEAARELEATRERIARESESARAGMRARIDELAAQIAQRLLGRPT